MAVGLGRFLSPIWLVILAVAGCAVRASVFATVGRSQVELDAFQTYLGAVTGDSWQAVEDRVAARLLDQFLDQEVVAAAARAHRDVRIPIDPAARSAAVRSLLTEVCGSAPDPDPSFVEAEVDRRMATGDPARVRVRHMLLGSLEEAKVVRARLEAGQDFADVAAEVSRAPDAGRGGVLGLVSPGTLPEELDKVIFALGQGEISEPVRGPSGFHIFQVLEIVPSGAPQRARVVADVVRDLREQQARGFTEECVERLADQVGVVLYTDHLWFRYNGRYAEGTNETK